MKNTQSKLNTLLANPEPNEFDFEQIGKCYQELGDYEKAIANLDNAYIALRAYFPVDQVVRNPYLARRQVCEKLLAAPNPIESKEPCE